MIRARVRFIEILMSIVVWMMLFGMLGFTSMLSIIWIGRYATQMSHI